MHVNDDITADGWLALCIAILCGCPQQEAFRKLDNPFSKRQWTEEDYMEMEHLRSQGKKWDYIGEMFNTDGSNVCRRYNYWKSLQKK